jgi:hypothetical protein
MESADVEGSMKKQLRWVRRVNCRGAVSSTQNLLVYVETINKSYIGIMKDINLRTTD